MAKLDTLLGAIGYLICALGTACIYYGTEQGFEGHGDDNSIREAMFDRSTPGLDLLNPGCNLYKEIGKIARVAQAIETLKFGRMYFRPISGDGVNFGLPFGTTYTLAFSRILYGKETLVAYNVSSSARSDRVVIDSSLHNTGDTLTYLYGGIGGVTVQQAADGTRFVQLNLPGYQFAILG